MTLKKIQNRSYSCDEVKKIQNISKKNYIYNLIIILSNGSKSPFYIKISFSIHIIHTTPSVGTPPCEIRGTHLTVTHGMHCHPSHPHPDLPIKHTCRTFYPDCLKEEQTTLTKHRHPDGFHKYVRSTIHPDNQHGLSGYDCPDH